MSSCQWFFADVSKWKGNCIENLTRSVTEMRGIVAYPATVQTLKGIISGGPLNTVRYSVDKLAKWWQS